MRPNKPTVPTASPAPAVNSSRPPRRYIGQSLGSHKAICGGLRIGKHQTRNNEQRSALNERRGARRATDNEWPSASGERRATSNERLDDCGPDDTIDDVRLRSGAIATHATSGPRGTEVVEAAERRRFLEATDGGFATAPPDHAWQ